MSIQIDEWQDINTRGHFTYQSETMRVKRKLEKTRGKKCQHCGRLCGISFARLHAHHIVPISKRGTNNPNNLILLCPDCHAFEHHGHGVGC